MEKTLLSKDVKGKIRVVNICCDWNEEKRGFLIDRKTYQLNGKITQQPPLIIQKGKAGRTVTAQANLEFASHCQKYLDKGYKEYVGSLKDTERLTKFIDTYLGDLTDSNGAKKHMLAKDGKKIATSTFDKIDFWYGSRKLDGVRCSFRQFEGNIKTTSRGGKHYDASTEHIRNHPTFRKIFEDNPDLELDGELYIHGRSLQYISGLARVEKDTSRCIELEYWIYDIMDSELSFDERLSYLEQLVEDYNLTSDLYSEFASTDLKVRILPHEKVSGWTNIKKLHDRYVDEGFEGIVIRDPDRTYNYGGRTNDMIKWKEYRDEEFEIVGYSEGLRPEDMVFVCKTVDGKEFEAKPFGSREIIHEYLERMDEIIGKMATVKFFNYSDDGKPTQPNLKCIRDYE